MSKKRKHYTPEEKVSILRRHLLDGVPVSDLCDAHGIHPTMFYKWQKVFFEHVIHYQRLRSQKQQVLLLIGEH